MLAYNKDLKPIARSLRANMTVAEGVLWSRLRRKQLRGCQFYRQKIIGGYIVDFYCPSVGLVIEVDGAQHRSREIAPSDRLRDEYMANQGLTTLRFTNSGILRGTNAVIATILSEMTLRVAGAERGGVASSFGKGMS